MTTKQKLKHELMKLNLKELKVFYTMIVHYWVKARAFISEQSFLNLWCEVNQLCHEVDESFPDPYDDYELMKSFCHEHPYYFIDILCPELVINLFYEHLDDRIDVLTTIINKLHTEGIRAAYECSDEALGLNESIDELVAETERYIGCCV